MWEIDPYHCSDYNINRCNGRELTKKVTDIFGEVNTRLDSLIDVVLKRAPDAGVAQKVGMINSRKQITNVQVLPHVIEANSEDVNTSIQQFQDISLKINELPTQTLE